MTGLIVACAGMLLAPLGLVWAADALGHALGKTGI